MEVVREYFSKIWMLLSSIDIFDFVDIILIAVLLFYAFRFIRDRRAGKLIAGIVILLIFQIFAINFGLRAVDFILGNFFKVGVLALIILFQPELRSALEKVGSEPLKGLKIISEKNMIQSKALMIDSICNACHRMSMDKTGALIAIERETKLGEYINTGTVVDASPSSSLIENIFFKNSPLHDGAVIFRDERLYAAGCFLPLTGSDEFRELGTRHHAAIGLSELSDAIVIVVSEQTGTISVTLNGKLKRNVDLKNFLRSILLESSESDRNGKKKKAKGQKNPIDETNVHSENN